MRLRKIATKSAKPYNNFENIQNSQNIRKILQYLKSKFNIKILILKSSFHYLVKLLVTLNSRRKLQSIL